MSRNNKNKFKKLSPKNTLHFNLEEEPPKDYNSKKPIFSFRYMQYGGNHCLSRCDRDSKSSIVDTLLRLSQRKWSEIISTSKTGLGCESIPFSRFRVNLPNIITPDVTLNVFRYSDSGRIAGFREKDIYHLLVIGTDLYSH